MIMALFRTEYICTELSYNYIGTVAQANKKL
jgi:hypothetical protein